MSFAEQIEKAAGDQPIEAVVIGGFGWGSIGEDEGAYGISEDRQIPADKQGVVLSWEEARPLLDYEYDQGYGAPDCHAITAYTRDLIISVHEYDDGSTGVGGTQRNPVDHEPRMA